MKKILMTAILGLMVMGCENTQIGANGDATSLDDLDENLTLMSVDTLGEENDLVEDGDEVPEEFEDGKVKGRLGKFRRHVRRLTRQGLLEVIDPDATVFERREIAARAVFLCRMDIRKYIQNEFDADGNGEFSAEEREDLRQARRDRRQGAKQRHDQDGNDRLTRDEARQMAHTIADARIQSILDKFDVDHDEVITLDEVEQTGLPDCQIPEIE